MKNIIKSGDICIDIGANLGYISVKLSKLVGNEGKVFAVEPVRPVLKVLKLNTKRRKNIKILPYALGEGNKMISLGNNTIRNQAFVATGSHFILEKGQEAAIEFEAEMRKGSDLFKNLERLDFIKCDIEGYEKVVIPELEEIITKHEPILLVEARRESRIKMLSFFKRLNYHAFVLENGELKPAKQDGNWDILFVPKNNSAKVEAFIGELEN